MFIFGTFPDTVRKNHVTVCCDSVAVASCMVNVSEGAKDQNLVIGRAWLEVCRFDIGLIVYRVETHSNPSDELARKNDCILMKLVEAKLREAKFPGWAQQV